MAAKYCLMAEYFYICYYVNKLEYILLACQMFAIIIDEHELVNIFWNIVIFQLNECNETGFVILRLIIELNHIYNLNHA